MAIGAGVADRRTPTVAIAGDGGCLFTISELATAADRGRQLSLVIWDNRGYGEIRDSFLQEGIPPVGVDTSAHNLEAIAAGIGFACATVTEPDQLANNLQTSLRADRPNVIVIRADHEQIH
ncbi:thiamine pyrophosphate-dependent enzyme [Streptomyces yanii]|uniref:thiamine pyrophosphate-dependent enzyme n=1 Tax=Streptomyces yanii TaxID=78510 RepID=UPI00336F1EF5